MSKNSWITLVAVAGGFGSALSGIAVLKWTKASIPPVAVGSLMLIASFLLLAQNIYSVSRMRWVLQFAAAVGLCLVGLGVSRLNWSGMVPPDGEALAEPARGEGSTRTDPASPSTSVQAAATSTATTVDFSKSTGAVAPTQVGGKAQKASSSESPLPASTSSVISPTSTTGFTPPRLSAQELGVAAGFVAVRRENKLIPNEVLGPIDAGFKVASISLCDGRVLDRPPGRYVTSLAVLDEANPWYYAWVGQFSGPDSGQISQYIDTALEQTKACIKPSISGPELRLGWVNSTISAAESPSHPEAVAFGLVEHNQELFEIVVRMPFDEAQQATATQAVQAIAKAIR